LSEPAATQADLASPTEAARAQPASPTAKPSHATLYAFEHLQSSAPPDPRAPQQALLRAQAEADAIRTRAHQEGFQQGIAEGKQ
jgi:hypothetical protein